MMENEDRMAFSRLDVLEILAQSNQGAANDMASEIQRLNARIGSLEAEIRIYESERTPVTRALEKRVVTLQEDNRILAGNVTEIATRLQEREAELTQAQAHIEKLMRENHRLQGEQEGISKHAERLEEQNRSLVERATEPALHLLQEAESAATRAQIELAIHLSENERLQAA